MKRVAVVILNYNGAEMLRTFLPGVVECSPEAEVVVADNASTDDSVEVVQRLFPTVRLIRLEQNWGFADGYNKALEQVDAEYSILLNSDVEVTKGWIVPMLAALDADSNVVACQPKILDYKRKTHFEYAGAAGGFIDRYGYPYCRGRVFDTLEEDKGQYDTVCDISWATGAALMIRTAEYRTAGGLDGRFFAHMEEIDLCWRLRARARRILCVPQSTVYHVGGATLSKSNPKKTYLNFRNNLLMLYKNLQQEEFPSVMRVRCLLDYVAALKFLLTGGFGDFKAVLRARRDYCKMRDSYVMVRKENLALTVGRGLCCLSPFSILWRYHFGGKKFYSEL